MAPRKIDPSRSRLAVAVAGRDAPPRTNATRRALLLCLACLFLPIVCRPAPTPAFAQEQPAQTQPGASPTTTVAPAPSGEPETAGADEHRGWLPEWLSDPRSWASDVFTQSVTALLQTVAGLLRSAVAAVLDSSANFITRTPPGVSYDSPTVRSLWGVTRTIADAALVMAALWGGFTLITREHLRTGEADVAELFSRLAVGTLLANTSLWWGQFFVDANNALCLAFGEATLPAWDRVSGVTQALATVLATLVYLIASLLLVLQQLMRLALLDLLLVVAPPALICWTLPSTQAWARRWSSAFGAVVFVQFLQVVALKLGSALVLELTPMSPDTEIVSLLLGVAVLALTLRLPAMVQAHHGDSLGFARYYAYRRGAQTLDAARSGGGGR